MKVSQIVIERSLGQIGITKIPSQMKLNRINPNVEINYGGEKPFQVVDSLEIKNSSTDLKIDQSKILEEYGFYKVRRFTKYLDQKEKKNISKSISEIVQEGDYLAKIEDKNKISTLVKKELNKKKSFGVALLPKNKPEIDIDIKQMQVDVKKNKIKVDSDFRYPEFNYKEGKTEIYLKKEGYLNISLKGNTINLKT